MFLDNHRFGWVLSVTSMSSPGRANKVGLLIIRGCKHGLCFRRNEQEYKVNVEECECLYISGKSWECSNLLNG